MNEKSLSNRILGWSFLASLAINFAWIAWVSHSGIFGSAQSSAGLHPQRIRIFKPMVVKAKQPAPVRTAKPKEPPRQRPAKPIRPVRLAVPPPRPAPHRAARVQPRPVPKPASSAPRPVPTRPRPVPARPKPMPPQPIAAQRQPAPKAAAPRSPVTSAKGGPGPAMTTTPGESAPQRLHKPGGGLMTMGMGSHPGALVGTPAGTGLTPPPSVRVGDGGARDDAHSGGTPHSGGHDAQQPSDASAKADNAKPPSNFDRTTAERNEAEAIGGFPAPETSDLDTSTLTGDCVLTIEVNEEGHASRVRIKHSSGNREFDNRCIEIAKRVHYRPAVQNHLRFSSRFEQTWSPSS